MRVLDSAQEQVLQSLVLLAGGIDELDTIVQRLHVESRDVQVSRIIAEIKKMRDTSGGSARGKDKIAPEPKSSGAGKTRTAPLVKSQGTSTLQGLGPLSKHTPQFKRRAKPRGEANAQRCV